MGGRCPPPLGPPFGGVVEVGVECWLVLLGAVVGVRLLFLLLVTAGLVVLRGALAPLSSANQQ